MQATQIVGFLRKLALLGFSEGDGGMRGQAGLINASEVKQALGICENDELAQQVWEGVHSQEVSLIGLKR